LDSAGKNVSEPQPIRVAFANTEVVRRQLPISKLIEHNILFEWAELLVIPKNV
jgi:hypothetical protein